MSRFSRFVILVVALLMLTIPTFTQGNAQWSNVIVQLLEYPAPPPPMLKVVADAMAAQEKRAKWRQEHPDAEPGDDAIAAELIEYWSREINRETGKQPSEQTRWKLLDAYLEERGLYFPAAQLLPDTSQAHERVKQFLAQPEPPNLSSWESFEFKDAQERLRAWLMQHSEYFRDELVQAASEVKMDGWRLVGENSLTALARMDWKRAQPLLENYRKHSVTTISTLALRLLYLHAVEEKENRQAEELRQQLQRIVISPQAKDDAREMAYQTVMEHEWAGREEWFTSLFANEQLLAKKQPLLRTYKLAAPVRSDPEKWIPILRPLVASTIPTIHNNAALCLNDAVFRKPHRDALLLLLPWLVNPQWATAGDEYDRHHVIEAMGEVQLPEAVSGLLSILQNEKGYVQTEAIGALSKYRDPNIIARVLPVVQSLVQRQPPPEHLSALIQLLMDLGGLGEKEKVKGLEAFAAQAEVQDSRGGSRLYLHEAKSLDEEIGTTLAQKQQYEFGSKFDTATLAAQLVERWRVLRRENPPLAAKLWLIVARWDYPVIDVAMAEQIADGSANLGLLLIALEQRQRLTVNAGATLQPMLQRRGAAVGIATVLLNDEAKAHEILQGQDQEAQLALLACARVARQPLPVPMVGALLEQKESLLTLAAECYLESEDNAAARKLILARHKGEALILGAYEDFTPKPKDKDKWTNWENALREEVRQGQADEIIGEFEHHWSDSGAKHPYQNVEIRIRGEQATICQRKDGARQECRTVLPEELSALRALFDEVNFDELTPMNVPGNGFVGMAQEFIWFNKNGGRRVFATNLFDLRGGSRNYGLKEPTPHERLVLSNLSF